MTSFNSEDEMILVGRALDLRNRYADSPLNF